MLATQKTLFARVTVTLLAAAAILVAPQPLPIVAAEIAILEGTLLDPSGQPARGLQAVVRDLQNSNEYPSSPTDANGAYRIEIPAGPVYVIVAAITPDGVRLPVQQSPPMPIRVPGTYRLPDVMFSQPSAGQPGSAVARPALSNGSVDTPWYRTPGGIIGITVGTVAVAVLALDSGGGTKSSPSSP